MLAEIEKEKLRNELHDKCGLYLYGTEIDKVVAIIAKYPTSFSAKVSALSEPATGKEARDEGIQTVKRHMDYEWKQAATLSVRHLLERNSTITGDDVWMYIDREYPHVKTHDPRALGPIMVEAQSNKWCVTTDTFVPSVRKKKHAGPTRVWKSLLHSIR